MDPSRLAPTNPDQPLQDQRLVRELRADQAHPRNLSHEGRQVHSCLDRLQGSVERVTAGYIEVIAAVAVVLGEVRR
jgi:hypothetical protein